MSVSASSPFGCSVRWHDAARRDQPRGARPTSCRHRMIRRGIRAGRAWLGRNTGRAGSRRPSAERRRRAPRADPDAEGRGPRSSSDVPRRDARGRGWPAPAHAVGRSVLAGGRRTGLAGRAPPGGDRRRDHQHATPLAAPRRPRARASTSPAPRCSSPKHHTSLRWSRPIPDARPPGGKGVRVSGGPLVPARTRARTRPDARAVPAPDPGGARRPAPVASCGPDRRHRRQYTRRTGCGSAGCSW